MSATPRRGFALIAALALLVLISLVALGVSATVRPRRLALATVAEQLAAVEAATAGVEHARATLRRLELSPQRGGIRDGAPLVDAWSMADGMVIGPVAIGQLTYRMELRDANAQLHLNSASEDQLRQLLLALRFDSRKADRLAQAIADWRDGDQRRRVNGAERSEYLRAGRAMLPEDAAFGSVATLRFVIGMTDSLYEVVRPYVTVFGSGRVNLNEAERPVLLALPGITEEAASLLVRRRRAGRRVTDLYRFGDELSPAARQRLREAMPVLSAMTVLETREVHVAGEAWQPAGISRVHVDAVISRDAEGSVVWRRFVP
jgi:general secretion pathway protein K